MLFGQCNEWPYYPPPGRHCSQCPLLAKEKTNERIWFINPSCVFIKLITADYKLKYNIKVSVICNKASRVSLTSLYFENSTIGTYFTSALMCDLRGLILAKSGIHPATFSPKRL